MRLQTIPVYKFEELDESAKERARDQFKELDYDRWDCFIDQYEQVLESIGFSNIKIYFSLSYSQGGYAAICGHYRYKKGALAAIKKEYPHWKELHNFCAELQAIQKRNGYNLAASFTNGRGGFTRLESASFTNWDRWVSDETEKELQEAVYSFSQDIYYSLRKEYEYLTNDEQIEEQIESMGYEFYEDGSIA